MRQKGKDMNKDEKKAEEEQLFGGKKIKLN